MKKYSIILLITLSIIFFVSCSGKGSDDDTYVSSENDYFQYNIDSIIFDYDIYENDLYYYTIVPVANEEGVDADGKAITYEKTEGRINVMNSEGNLLNTYNTINLINNFRVIDKNKIIHTSNTPDGFILYEYDLVTQESVKICEFTDYTDIPKIAVYDNYLYFIGTNKNYLDKEYTLASVEDRFRYGGERIGYVDLETGELKELAVDLPIIFSKTLDGNIVIYAYDESKGYYFTMFNKSNGSLSESIYNNLGALTDFDVFNSDNDFMHVKFSSLTYSLCTTSLEPDKVDRELIPNFPFPVVNGIKCHSDYTYYTDMNGKNIIRIKNSAYVRGSKMISMLTTESTKSISPFGCGYNIYRDTVTNEEMALALLSQDSSFDICTINSRQQISANIRNKGSFYPLNKVKGVKEYLDSCFPYIKDAATNADGDIWMLPIMVDVNCFLYNEQICKDNDIEFSNNMELDYLFDTVDKLNTDGSKKESYLFISERIIRDLLYQYTRSNNNFDTNVFREFAQICRNKINYITNDHYGNPSLLTKLSIDKSSDFLFLNPLGLDYLLNIANNKEIRACRIPGLTDNKASAASCIFITVNPASKNLKETLKYISSLCSYLSSRKDNLIFKDRDRYPDTQVMDDIYEIFSNASVEFTYPDDIYLDNFEKYLQGNMDLESMIKEANRRLDTFLNE